MKFLRTIFDDIRKKQNLDFYLTVLAVVILIPLGVFQIVDSSVIFSAILAVLALVSYNMLVTRRDNTETQIALEKVSYMQERFDDLLASRGISFTFVPVSQESYQVATQKIRKLVEKAAHEILVLDFNPLEEKEQKIRYKESDKKNIERSKYYAALLEKIHSSENGNFKYKRVLQIPDGRHVSEVMVDDDIFREHCVSLVSIEEKNQETASLKVCAPFQERTFIIIDRRSLILEWIILDPNDRYYSDGGYLFFDDPDGNLVNSFIRIFERADAISTLVKSKDLLPR